MRSHPLYRRCRKLFRTLKKEGKVKQEGNVAYGDGRTAPCYNAPLRGGGMIECQKGRYEPDSYLISVPNGRYMVEKTGLDPMTLTFSKLSRAKTEQALDKILKANGV